MTFFHGEDARERRDVLTALLMCALKEAAEWKLRDVVVWDAGEDVLGAVEGLEKVWEERRRETVSVRWRGGEEVSVRVEPDEHFAWS